MSDTSASSYQFSYKARSKGRKSHSNHFLSLVSTLKVTKNHEFKEDSFHKYTNTKDAKPALESLKDDHFHQTNGTQNKASSMLISFSCWNTMVGSALT